jgi:hypothetical protein
LPQNLIWFFSSILLFLILYFGIVVRDKQVINVHKEFSKVIFGEAKEKVVGMNREVITLLVFEFIFALIIALSIAFYLDPELEFPGLSKVPFPFNLIAFVAFVAFGLYIFSQTRPFREIIYPKPVIKRILPAEKITPLKRITNKKRNVLKIRGKTHHAKINMRKKK